MTFESHHDILVTFKSKQVSRKQQQKDGTQKQNKDRIG